MPNVRKPVDKDTVIAVLISDCHFSADKPKARAGTQEQWWDTQCAHLEEAMRTAHNLNCPLVIAGDVFDTWNQPVDLVTMIAEVMAAFQCPVYMVPGQHDLPYHELHEVGRSAIYNLMMASRGMRRRSDVYLLTSNILPLGDTGWWVYGAAWGMPFDYATARTSLTPETGEDDGNILLCAHKYVYSGRSTAHPGAKQEDCSHGRKMRDALAGYTACVFGDNHIPFLDDNVYNHGALIRRKSDERKFIPEYGLLYRFGRIERVQLEASGKDMWHDGEDEYAAPDKKPAALMTDFAESVKALASDETVDFKAVCNRLLGQSNLSTAAKREILSLLDE